MYIFKKLNNKNNNKHRESFFFFERGNLLNVKNEGFISEFVSELVCHVED